MKPSNAQGRREITESKSRLLRHFYAEKLSLNFAFCALPNFGSWYFDSETEGHELSARIIDGIFGGFGSL